MTDDARLWSDERFLRAEVLVTIATVAAERDQRESAAMMFRAAAAMVREVAREVPTTMPRTRGKFMAFARLLTRRARKV